MVKENLDVNSRILDFDLNKYKHNQQHQQHLTNVVNELKHRQDNLSTPLKPPDTAADRLSWNFFEEISDVDNQLRTNETNTFHYTPTKIILTSSEQPSKIDEEFQQNAIISRKTNGYAQTAIHVSSADVFSQPDVILKHQQLAAAAAAEQNHQPTFQFTSPTSTFKRKKLLQIQREQHQSEQNKHNIYNNSSPNNNTDIQGVEEEEGEQAETAAIYHNSLSPILNFNTVTVFTSKNHKTISNNNSNSKSGNSNNEQSSTLKRSHIKSHNEPLEVANTMISTGAGVIVNKGNTITTTTTLPNKAKITNTATNSRKLNATIGRLPDNGSTITCDDTKPVSGNQGTTTTTRRLNIRRGMGIEGSSSAARSSRSSKMGGDGYSKKMDTHLNLYGWRKKCLYAILVVLMLLITINLMLTFWILQVMEFSTEGMGLLKIIPGGVQLTGQTLIMDILRASTIRSRHGQPIAIESSRNFSINTRDKNGVLENHLFLGHDKLECLATGFRINDTAGRNLFSVNRNEVTIGAHALKIDGEGGAVFRESIQTPHIRAEPGRELRLESPTRQLEITAAKDINLQSRAGGIDLSALEDVKLSALDGSLRLESSKILMPNLRTAQTPLPGATQNREHLHRVFQLCACANGKLFLAAPHSICAGDDSTVCR